MMTADSTQVSLCLRGVSLSVPGRSILNEVDLSICAGEFIGVLGPNGAGKTTLMRAVLGLISPAQGHIEVLGRKATRGNPQVGYMPQWRDAGLAAEFRGWDLVAGAVQGRCWGVPLLNRAQKREVEWALDLVGATGLAFCPLGALSGGERQRLLLAQALLGRPKLLLLDEPLAGLDPYRQHDVVDLVHRVQQELRMTVLFSAHDLNPLLPVMDRVLYLGGGKAALGPVDQVVDSTVLSRLYGAPIEVARVNGRIFVMVGPAACEGGGI